ncbi:MAG TPA: hypothetical protein VM425_14220 [Myxococcota bacterium]|nr:hypothetical protein [Myxococcota bacterium]
MLVVFAGLPAWAQKNEERVILVLPIFGAPPPEMDLPGAEHMAESLLLQLPGENLRVITERPAGRVPMEDLESTIKARASELDARAAIWGELKRPADCKAPRIVRIRILDPGANTILDRDLCPEGTGAETLSLAIAVACANALRSGLIQSLGMIGDAARKKIAAGIPPARRKVRKRMKCPKQKACPTPVPCPVCKQEKILINEPRRFFRLSAGPFFTSHPRWESYGVGAMLEISWAPLDWLEFGLGIRASRGRRIEVTEVRAVYSSWPLYAWARGLLGNDVLQGTLDLGFVADWSRLDALLDRFDNSIRIDRFNPAISCRLGVLWWIRARLGLHLLAGSTVYLRRQRYSYSYLGLPVEVLDLSSWSLETALMLVVPFS